MVHIRYHVFHFLLSLVVVCYSKIIEDSLVLVHIIFRHGERTVLGMAYPNDPYINDTSVYGPGDLTMKGKAQEYRLGQALRSRYDEFLGPNFDLDMVEALTSDVRRTKMSLLLVLAGLFPPNDEELIFPGLNWQPVPYSYLPCREDKIFDGSDCPNFKNMTRNLLESKTVQYELKKNKKLFGYLSEKSGLNITDFDDIFHLYNRLKTEEELGLKLPEWVGNIYTQLQSAAMKSYRISMGTVNLRRLAVGYMVQKIINDTMNKISGEMESNAMKMYIYSAHEYNLSFILILLELFDEKMPPFASYILFELHNFDDKYGFKIFYQNYEEEEPKLLKLPWCSEFCPLKYFMHNLTQYMPAEDLCGY